MVSGGCVGGGVGLPVVAGGPCVFGGGECGGVGAVDGLFDGGAAVGGGI